MPYNNPQYWEKLHKSYSGTLRAVGHPFLSENINRLKYESEAISISQVLSKVAADYKKRNTHEISFLDVGAGTGYWTVLILNEFSSNFQVKSSALDISMDALAILKKQFPDVELLHEDLAKIQPDQCLESYDLVFSGYCLHHLVNTYEFINALRFAGSSVRKGGFLLIMDPILSMPYSHFDTINFNSYTGNGIPRHLYLIDDLLGKLGLKRQLIKPAVSFVLNENIEASGPISYGLMTFTWKVLCKFYLSDKLVRIFNGPLRGVDKLLKSTSLSFSSSVCLYQKD